MKFKKKIIASSLVSSGALISTFLFPFVPCKKIPNVPNPSSSYSMCTLNPDIANTFDSTINYLGYTSNLTTAYFVVLFGTFFLSFLFLTLFSKKRR